MIAIGLIAMFLIGAGVGYAVGWNRAAHPGKVEAQLADAVDRAKAAEQSVQDKLTK